MHRYENRSNVSRFILSMKLLDCSKIYLISKLRILANIKTSRCQTSDPQINALFARKMQ